MSSNNKFALFCDDVRQEVNGKLIAIGIYSGGINVPSFPWGGGLSTLISLGLLTIGEHSVRCSFKSTSGAVFGQLEATIDNQSATVGVLFPTPALAFSLSSPDTIELYVGVDGAEEKLVATMPVALGSAPNPFGLPTA